MGSAPFKYNKMSEQPPAAQSTSLFGSIYNLGGSIVSYAADTLNSFLGWEDLDVVDPEAESAQKGGKKADDGVNQNVSRQVQASTHLFHRHDLHARQVPSEGW